MALDPAPDAGRDEAQPLAPGAQQRAGAAPRGRRRLDAEAVGAAGAAGALGVEAGRVAATARVAGAQAPLGHAVDAAAARQAGAAALAPASTPRVSAPRRTPRPPHYTARQALVSPRLCAADVPRSAAARDFELNERTFGDSRCHVAEMTAGRLTGKWKSSSLRGGAAHLVVDRMFGALSNHCFKAAGSVYR